jgi:sugar/nucleoside kinase (ribokinase family)
MPRYVIVGCTELDTITFVRKRYPPMIGGNALYAAAGAHVWSDDIGIVSVLGRGFPDDGMALFRMAGIDTAGIVPISLPVQNVRMTYAQDDTRTIHPGVIGAVLNAVAPSMLDTLWERYSPTPDAIPIDYRAAEAVHIAPMAHAAQTRMVEAFADGPGIVLIDPPPVLRHPGEVPATHADFSLATAVLPSMEEIHQYFGESTKLEAGIRGFRELGAQAVIVKRGAQGSVVSAIADKLPLPVPIYETTVVDPTGAGDAFCGGFLVGLDETGDLVEAAFYGAVSASFAIEGRGADTALHFSRDDAEKRLKKLKASVKRASK